MKYIISLAFIALFTLASCYYYETIEVTGKDGGVPYIILYADIEPRMFSLDGFETSDFFPTFETFDSSSAFPDAGNSDIFQPVDSSPFPDQSDVLEASTDTSLDISSDLSPEFSPGLSYDIALQEDIVEDTSLGDSSLDDYSPDFQEDTQEDAQKDIQEDIQGDIAPDITPCPQSLCNNVCCPPNQVCFLERCCQTYCDGRSCGDDGCGGECGECPTNTICNNDVSCIRPIDLCPDTLQDYCRCRYHDSMEWCWENAFIMFDDCDKIECDGWCAFFTQQTEWYCGF